jgi:hypothetical protein
MPRRIPEKRKGPEVKPVAVPASAALPLARLRPSPPAAPPNDGATSRRQIPRGAIGLDARNGGWTGFGAGRVIAVETWLPQAARTDAASDQQHSCADAPTMPQAGQSSAPSAEWTLNRYGSINISLKPAPTPSAPNPARPCRRRRTTVPAPPRSCPPAHSAMPPTS